MPTLEAFELVLLAAMVSNQRVNELDGHETHFDNPFFILEEMDDLRRELYPELVNTVEPLRVAYLDSYVDFYELGEETISTKGQSILNRINDNEGQRLATV